MSICIGVWKLWKTGGMWEGSFSGGAGEGDPDVLEKKQRMVEFGAFYLF